jgi:hypothetical protein
VNRLSALFTSELLVTCLYLIGIIFWIGIYGRKMIKRSAAYSFPIILFVSGTAMLILGMTYVRGWVAAGFFTYGLGIFLSSLVAFLIVFIHLEIQERRG